MGNSLPHRRSTGQRIGSAPVVLALSARKLGLATLLLAVSGFAAGCTGFGSTGDMMHESFRIFKPRVSDYRDHTQEEDDEWEAVGKEARGNRPLENENDPLKEWFMSPKAKAIERSLGYE